MKSLKGTKTSVNLMKSFAGESQAYSRYTYYSSIAKKEGFIQISNIFMGTAENEKEHAKRFFKFLNDSLSGEGVEINAEYPVALGDTKFNLLSAMKGENEEGSRLYPEFAEVAEAEGFTEIGYVFRKIAEVEKYHELRYKELYENLCNGTVFKKNKSVLWKCNNCGYVFEGLEAPDLCPACAHPKDYFEVFVESF
ncbi:MAG: rubrerythrin [Solirubrobacterales bacterium]